jgi:hypothetical protein
MKWILVFLFAFAMPIALAQAPVASPSPVAVASPAPAAASVAPQPPAWATELLQVVSGLPVVGPFVSKALLYVGILGALMTALVAFLLAASESIQQVTNWSGLSSFAAQVQAFQDGKIMYWLKTFSLFNAKPAPPPVAAAAPASSASPS